jgi:uncharacterized protein RhaS with RHS repeats
VVRDATLTLTYFGARYYDVGVGQFTSADTLQTDLNRYAYAGNNPETNVDPDGHCWPLCTMVIGALVGAAIGAGTSIVTQAASGHGVDWGQVGKQAAVGAVSIARRAGVCYRGGSAEIAGSKRGT